MVGGGPARIASSAPPSWDKATRIFLRLIPVHSGSRWLKAVQAAAVIPDGSAAADPVNGTDRGAVALLLHEAMLADTARAVHRTMVRALGAGR